MDGQDGRRRAGPLDSITLAVSDPGGVAARWGKVLGVQVSACETPLLRLQESEVRFEEAAPGRREGLVELGLKLPHELPGGAESVELAGVRLRRLGPARG